MTQIPVVGLNAELALGTAKMTAGVSSAMRDLGKLEGRMGETGRRARKSGDDIDRGFAKGLKGASDSARAFTSQIDRLANKFNPLMAASTRYERELNDLNRALQIGVVNQQGYEQQLERLNAELANGASGFSRAADQAQRYNGVAAGMSHQTGNIAAQFQDIGVQLAGGQSPFLIALQQGTQLNGVLGQMGGGIKGVAAGLGSAFMSLVSPLSLITIGAIAAGGALVQWALSGSDATDETKAFTDAVKELTDATEQFRVQAEAIRLGVDEREVVILEAVAAKVAEVTAAEQRLAANRGSQDRVDTLRAELAELEGQLEAYRGNREELEFAQAAADRLHRNMVMAYEVYARTRMEAQGLAQATADAARAAAQMRVEGVRREQDRRGGVVFDPRDPRFDPVAASAARLALDPNRGRTLADLAPTVSRGGGGGGGGVGGLARDVDRLNEAVSNGITPLDRYRAGLAKLDGLKAQGLSDAAYSQEVKKLNEELANSNPLVGDLADAFGNFVASGFKDFKGFTQAIGSMFKKLIADMVSTALRNRIMIGLGVNVSGGGGGGAAGAASAASGLLSGAGGLSNLLFSGGTGTAGTPAFGGLLSGGLGVLGPLAVGGLLIGGLLSRRRRRRQARAAAAQAAAQEAQAEAQERAQLDARLLQIQGDTTELRRRELEALRPANRELQERIWRLEDEKRIGEERKGLETQLLQLQGNTAELRRRELETLDPSNRALQENIWRLEDATEATDKLNDALGRLSADEFATALDFNRARGMLASGANPASSPAQVQAALAAIGGTGSGVLGGMTDTILASINSFASTQARILQTWEFGGMPPVRT